MDAVALAHAIAFAGDGDALPAEAVAWLRTGLRRWLRGDADLVTALALTGGTRVACRNRALLVAASILDAGRGLSAWQLAKELCTAQAHFEGSVLVQLQRGIDVALSPLNENLLTARRSGASRLGSQRRLYDLLLTNSP